MAKREDFEGGFEHKVRKVQIVVELEIQSETAGEARLIASRAFAGLFVKSDSRADFTTGHDYIIESLKPKPDFSTMRVIP